MLEEGGSESRAAIGAEDRSSAVDGCVCGMMEGEAENWGGMIGAPRLGRAGEVRVGDIGWSKLDGR